jgi:hypothetical protein
MPCHASGQVWEEVWPIVDPLVPSSRVRALIVVNWTAWLVLSAEAAMKAGDKAAAR